MERRPQRTEWLSLFASGWRRSVRQRRDPPTRRAELESRLQTEGGSGYSRVQENRPLFRSQCVLAAVGRDLRKRGARRFNGTSLRRREHVVPEADSSEGALERAVPG